MTENLSGERWVAERALRRWFAFLIVMAMAASVGVVVTARWARGAKNPLIVGTLTTGAIFSGSGSFVIQPQLVDGQQEPSSLGPPSPELRKSYEEAQELWEKELKMPIKAPRLYVEHEGHSHCGYTAIACYDASLKIIVWCNRPVGPDPKTVLMHELGHSLGVPHIDGDPLMSSDYQEKPLDRPSRFAVAIARENIWK